ncbi:uncharacterized protein SPPG_06612 [Spizellomyces punctatus DAOM BR117]|uniref:Uncharacterized protein n=1 Tax=Spizellomyces punctatus (strain DAOM BR117) TaxID=645134 RepID=A0A0L0HAL8_SPIPD|nr:uncharacterized protein SPPG_06612 [Spizellomyces punctatus DAOM BR117]KNC98212.1 hypothetical protein SPPG_06612 [Spizellomyces punctatus DAOM BR117]|eukprot:XP_016606252.1 hypothetical protein SPPG_06612 [Spizellomyces punctatus DAOM BR117]
MLVVSTTTVIPSMLLYALSLAIGLLNVLHTIRRVLSPGHRTIAYFSTASQFIMLVSYVISTVNAVHYARGEYSKYQYGVYLSELFLVAGSFMLLRIAETYLPVVQIHMGYNASWNKAVRGWTLALFSFVLSGIIAATAAQQILDPTKEIHKWLFAAWGLYAAVSAAALSLLVIRLVVNVKADVSLRNAGRTGLEAVKFLEGTLKKAILAASIAVPGAIVLGIISAFPYSILLDGLCTFYISLYCAWLFHMMYTIRTVITFTPSQGEYAAPTRLVNGVEAVEESRRSENAIATTTVITTKRRSIRDI